MSILKSLGKIKEMRNSSLSQDKQLEVDVHLTVNPLTTRIFTVFLTFIRGQSVTQRSIGREAPRYPPQCPENSSMVVKGLRSLKAHLPQV